MINSKKQVVPVLATLHALNRKYGKLYCYPSQVKILALLDVYQDIKISIATLNRWLRDGEDKGYLIRIRRIKHDKRKGILFQSTLYKITLPGYHALACTGVNVYIHIKRLMAESMRVAGKSLAKYKGPVPMKAIIESTLLFGGRKTALIKQ